MKGRVIAGCAFAVYLTVLAGAATSTSPVADAAMRADNEALRTLLKQGADVGALTRVGQYTPLHLASKSGSAAVVRALLKAGASPAAKTTNTGVTALHL